MTPSMIRELKHLIFGSCFIAAAIFVMAGNDSIFDASFLGRYEARAVIANRGNTETMARWGIAFTGESAQQVVTQIWTEVRIPASSSAEHSIEATAPPAAWRGIVGLQPGGNPDGMIVLESV